MMIELLYEFINTEPKKEGFKFLVFGDLFIFAAAIIFNNARNKCVIQSDACNLPLIAVGILGALTIYMGKRSFDNFSNIIPESPVKAKMLGIGMARFTVLTGVLLDIIVVAFLITNMLS